jgi:ferredoxin-NADP reductase
VGRVTPALLARHIAEPATACYFLCGPGEFVDTLSAWLRENGVEAECIHSRRFENACHGALPLTVFEHANSLGIAWAPMVAP